VPVDALTRYSVDEGENGPPWGPKKAMLVDGVTINDGGDSAAGRCAALVCVNISIADVASKPIEAIRPMAILVGLNGSA
jgi:hypothetical protein